MLLSSQQLLYDQLLGQQHVLRFWKTWMRKAHQQN